QRESHRVDGSLALKLKPDFVESAARQDELEVEPRKALEIPGMFVEQVNEVPACGQEMSPRAEAGFQSGIRLQLAQQTRLPAFQGWRSVAKQRDMRVLGAFLSEVRSKIISRMS